MCKVLLESTSKFEIRGSPPEGFFEVFGEPLRCPKCDRHFVVENGIVSYELNDDHGPYEFICRKGIKDRIMLFVMLGLSLERMGTRFRVEDLAEAAGDTGIPFDDLPLYLAEGDLDVVEPFLRNLLKCDSGGLIGEAMVIPNYPGVGQLTFSLGSPHLLYRELCRRIFAFYEPGSLTCTGDRRFYRLIWKAMKRIHERESPNKSERVPVPEVLEAARKWARDTYGKRLVVTPPKIRALKAVMERHAMWDAESAE